MPAEGPGISLAYKAINRLHIVMDDSASVTWIVGVLSCYLRHNPLASDTFEGIARWWMRTDDVAHDDLACALAMLTQAGVVEATTAADGQVRYRRTALNAEVDARLDRFIADSRTF